ncbi:hypothetical protein, partial [Leptospira noguchii]
MFLSMIVLEYTKNLKCCAADWNGERGSRKRIRPTCNPEKLLDKWNAHKDAMSQTPDGLKKWKEEVSRAGERSGIEVK